MRSGDSEVGQGEGRRRRGRGVWIAALVAACLAAGAGWAYFASQTAAPADVEQVVSLEESIRPLEQYFNQTKHQPRFLALLSPT